jgi:hypothetical protein
MDKKKTLPEWRLRATPDMHRVATGANRLSASMGVNRTTTLAAADELQAATKAAKAWFDANPCPDRTLGGFVADFLNTCAETALTAQRFATEADTEHEEARRHLGELLTLVDAQSRAFGTW